MMRSQSWLRILNLGLISSLESQAIYHAVATCMSEDSVDTIIICRPKNPYFCIGYHQNVRQVLNAEYRSKLDFPVVRRQLGGGATYLDNQQLFYQCIFHKKRSPARPLDVYRARLRQPIQVLKRIGIDAKLRHINEIEVLGRRIAGIGGGLIGEASVVVGNILNNFNFAVMSQIINSPCTAFREMAHGAMLERITTLQKEGRTEFWSQLPALLIEQYRQDYSEEIYLDEPSLMERNTAAGFAELMSSESYLNEIRPKTSLTPLTRLKISASTFIELIQVRRRNSQQREFAVLRIGDNVIEDVRYVDDVNLDHCTIASDFAGRILNANEVKIGMKLTACNND